MTTKISQSNLDSALLALIGSGGGGGGSSVTVAATAPVSPSTGSVWFNTENTTMYIWTGTAWVEPSGGVTGPTGPTGPAGNTVVILKISNVVITDNVYTTLDDTAVDTAGGYIKITGTGFASGIQVLVNQTPATSTTFVSSTEIRAQLPATVAGTYIVYAVNTDGSVGIRINGITFSATPTWTTSSSLPSSAVSSAISVQLAATSATTYALTSGSTLPTGLTLSSGGLLSGSVTGIASETTYSFSITATDAELQDSPRTFSITISIGEPYFSYTTLLLSGNGTNNAQNNTFVDSSTNNFAITRTGTPTQGTFSPFSQTGWSNYFGSGNYLSTSSNAAFGLGTGDFTLETWVFPTSAYTTYNYIFFVNQYGLTLYITGGNLVVRKGYVADVLSSTTIPALNVWTHIAVTRNGTTLRIFVNGIQTATTTDSFDWPQGNLIIGNDGTNVAPWNGYISNLRLVKGTALYTANFTPSIAPLTAISGTSILTCQSNRFKDNSSNAFAVTIAGTPSIEAFSPFAPGAGYSTSTVGGSIRFNGSTDYLSIASNAAWALPGDFTIEFWIYFKSITSTSPYSAPIIFGGATGAIWVGYITTGLGLRIAGVSNVIQALYAPSINTWIHVAITRSSNLNRLFFNGVLDTTVSDTTSYVQGPLTLGSDGSGFTNCNISNLRIVKGTALYTANFTPSTIPLTAVANTSILLSGTNAGIIDSTAKNLITTVGDAKISTTQSKFGGSSMYFDGTGDYLTFSTSPNLQFGTGNFTIELWTYLVARGTSGSSLINNYNAWAAGSLAIFAGHVAGNTAKYQVSYNGSGFPNIQSTTSISYNTWVHIAVVRSGTAITLYINGIADGILTGASAALNGVGSNWIIGTAGDGIADYNVNGYIDDLRITKGYARYTANFTPPVSQSQGQ